MCCSSAILSIPGAFESAFIQFCLSDLDEHASHRTVIGEGSYDGPGVAVSCGGKTIRGKQRTSPEKADTRSHIHHGEPPGHLYILWFDVHVENPKDAADRRKNVSSSALARH
jgi:hypothetical protein